MNSNQIRDRLDYLRQVDRWLVEEFDELQNLRNRLRQAEMRAIARRRRIADQGGTPGR